MSWTDLPRWFKDGLIALLVWGIIFLFFTLYKVGFFLLGPCDCLNSILYENQTYCKCGLSIPILDAFANGFFKIVTFPISIIGIITFNIGVIFLLGALIGLYFKKIKHKKVKEVNKNKAKRK